MDMSDPQHLHVHAPLAGPVELREKDRLRPVEQQGAVRDAQGDAVPEQARAEVRGGVATLAIREPRIVVLVARLLVHEPVHHARELVEQRGPDLGDQHGAGRVQAVGDDEPAVHVAALEGVPHL